MQTPIVGVIAEYNPLHRGHLHHIEESLKTTGAAGAIVILSSNFVQRGEPSLTDKWQRARDALGAGANLVIELPSVFSSQNAGVFANAAVDIIAATKTATHITFGLESPEWQTDGVLRIIVEEPESFKLLLKEHLRLGFSFVESRSLALDALIPGSSEMLKKPNNTLGLSYLQRILKKRYDLKPVKIKRLGSEYNDEKLSESKFSSATAIRKAISENRIDDALLSMPDFSANNLKASLTAGRACTDYKSLWDMLRTVILRSLPSEISQIAEITEGIEFKMKKEALRAKTFFEWADACTCKRYTRGRIKRAGLHILLGLENYDNKAFQRLGPPYIRVLAMDEKGRDLLKGMQKNASLPIITRCGDAARISNYAKKVMDYEILGCELWEHTVKNRMFGSEHARRIIIV